MTAVAIQVSRPKRSGHCRDDEALVDDDIAAWPPLRDLFELGVETDAVHPVLVEIAEPRSLPATEAVVSDRYGYRHVDPDHADFDGTGQPTRGLSAPSEWFNVNANTAAGVNICRQFSGVPGPINFFNNVGIPAKVKGFGFEITALPIPGLQFDWSGGSNKFPTGITPPAPGFLFPGNLRQPEWNMHANLSYDIVTPIGTFTPRADWNCVCRQPWDTAPNAQPPAPEFVINGYDSWNARVQYRARLDSDPFGHQRRKPVVPLSEPAALRRELIDPRRRAARMDAHFEEGLLSVRQSFRLPVRPLVSRRAADTCKGLR